MILSAQTAYTILEHIARKGSIFDEIIDNIIAPNFHQKPELISEIAVSFLTNEKSVNKAIKGNYFNYYFIRVVKNQLHSKTSPFHKNVRKTNTMAIPVSEIDIEDEEDDLQYKMLNERQNDLLTDVLDEIKVTWFEREIFRLYYEEGMTYRAIEAETGVDHSLCWVTIKKIKGRIKKQIRLKDIY
jgi:RNA polymerase sigma factor (sigma-70 family)